MKVSDFQKLIYKFYREHGRLQLLWRPPHLKIQRDGSIDPYKVLVSEIMLQQTQVSRVLPKYRVWIKQYPNIKKLAQAPLRDVLVLWQGLGYARRAKALHNLALRVVASNGEKVPKEYEKLLALPGVGRYTAQAILAFAFNKEAFLVETNIRTAIIHHFFRNKKGVTDAMIETMLRKVLDTHNSREWYYALMDYGAHLKSQGISYNSHSKHYSKQTRFEGSPRQVRGLILKYLASHTCTKKQLIDSIKKDKVLVGKKIEELLKEGLITKKRGLFNLG